MTLYDINAEIAELVANMVDPDTGEIDEETAERLASLHIDRQTKLENMACALVGLKKDKEAVNAEKTKLAKREKSIDKAIERLSYILKTGLDGEKLKSPRVNVYYRSSEATEVDEDFIGWAEENAPQFLTFAKPEANKTAIKEWLRAGNELDFARLVQNSSMIVK